MPGFTSFCRLPESSWRPLIDRIQGKKAKFPFEKKRLQRIAGPKPKSAIEAEMVGGNLTVWTTMVGTPDQPESKGKILFLEDVDEGFYRIDRYLNQLMDSGALNGTRAILLGTWSSCRDSTGSGLAQMPKNERERKRMIYNPRTSDLSPLRRTLDLDEGLAEIFGEIGDRLDIPVYAGLPVGHGPDGQTPLPLYLRYRLEPTGKLQLKR